MEITTLAVQRTGSSLCNENRLKTYPYLKMPTPTLTLIPTYLASFFLLLLCSFQVEATEIAFDGEELVSELRLYVEADLSKDQAPDETAEAITLEDEATGEAYQQVKVKQPTPDRPFHLNYTLTNAEEIAEGTPILIRVVADGQAEDGGAASIRPKVQLNERPWPTLAGDKSLPLADEPRTYDLHFEAPKDLDPRQISYLFQLGEKAQTINVRSLKAFVGDAIPETTQLEKAEVYSFDFEDKFIPVQPPVDAKGKITGALPAGLTEDTYWADTDVRYQQLTEMTHRGQGSLSIIVQEVNDGFAQIRIDNFEASSEQFLQIKGAFKSPTTSSFLLAIRKSTPPFTKYWKAQVSASPEWASKEFLVPPLPDDANAQLVMEFERPGVYDMDDLSITAIPKHQMESAQAVEGNLLPNSSFPFGFQRPWRPLTGNYRDGDYVTDTQQPGPTGAPSLKLIGDSSQQLIRIPFQGKPGSVHSVSLWAKSDAPDNFLAMRIGPPSEKLWVGDWGSTPILTTKWKRYFHKVKLPYHADGFYILELFAQNKDNIWIDGLSVKAGNRVGNFERVAPLELTLISPDKKNFHHLYFPGQSFSLNVGVLGEIPEGAQLKAEFESYMYQGYEGKNTFTQKLTPNEEGIIELQWQPEQLKLPEYGTYHLKIQALDANGSPLSKLAETVMHRIRQPRSWGVLNEGSAFGVHVAGNQAMVVTAKRLGFNWVRSFNMGWKYIQPEEGGKYDWRDADDLIRWYRENHLAVMGIFGRTPMWANMTMGIKKKGVGWKNGNHGVRDTHMEQWADYCARMAQRYEATIKTYETWNEPFLAGFFLDGVNEDGTWIHATPERLLKMTKAIRERLTKDEIEVTLAWNIGPHYHEGAVFENESAKLGMFDYIDYVTYHSYEPSLGGFPGDRHEEVIKEVKAFLKKWGHENMPVWNSEGGPGGGHHHNILSNQPIADMTGLEERYAQYLIRAWNTMLANGISKYFLYFLNEGGVWRGGYDLMQPSGDMAPNSVAFSNLAWHLENKKFVQLVPLAETFNAYVYAGKNDVAVSFVPRAVGTLEIPEKVDSNWSFSDLYGNTTQGKQSRDFWLYAEGKSAEQIITWLERQFPISGGKVATGS